MVGIVHKYELAICNIPTDFARVDGVCWSIKVPAAWAKRAWPSLRPLASWLADFTLRLAQLEEWQNNPMEVGRAAHPKKYNSFWHRARLPTGVHSHIRNRYASTIVLCSHLRHVYRRVPGGIVAACTKPRSPRPRGYFILLKCSSLAMPLHFTDSEGDMGLGIGQPPVVPDCDLPGERRGLRPLLFACFCLNTVNLVNELLYVIHIIQRVLQ